MLDHNQPEFRVKSNVQARVHDLVQHLADTYFGVGEGIEDDVVLNPF